MEQVNKIHDMKATFANENSWMVQCLSLATIGVLAYMQLAPVIA